MKCDMFGYEKFKDFIRDSMACPVLQDNYVDISYFHCMGT